MTRKLIALLETTWAIGACFLPILVWLADGRLVLLVALATFQFYLLLPPAAIGLWGLLRRRLRRHAPAVVCLLLLVVGYGPQFWPGRLRPTDDRDALVVATYNVRRSWDDPESQLRVLLENQADLVALQEATATPGVLLDDLAAAGYRCEHRAYSSRGRGAGLALCARPPLELLTVQRRTYHVKGRWPYLFAEVRHGARVLNVIVPHLLAFGISKVDPLRETRNVFERISDANSWHRQEARSLLAVIDQLADPIIVAGDFNSAPEQALHRRLRRHLDDSFLEAGFGFGATYRYFLPLRIDYVYASPEFAVDAAWVVDTAGSDHRPSFAALRLREEG